MGQKLLSEVVGANVKRAISLSPYRTQEEFSYVFGTPLRNVSRWVNEGVKSINIAQEIADVLELDVINLFIENAEDGKLCITK